MKAAQEIVEVMKAYIRSKRIEALTKREIWNYMHKPLSDWEHLDYHVKRKKQSLFRLKR